MGKPLHYKGCTLHRIIPQFMCQVLPFSLIPTNSREATSLTGTVVEASRSTANASQTRTSRWSTRVLDYCPWRIVVRIRTDRSSLSRRRRRRGWTESTRFSGRCWRGRAWWRTSSERAWRTTRRTVRSMIWRSWAPRRTPNKRDVFVTKRSGKLEYYANTMLITLENSR